MNRPWNRQWVPVGPEPNIVGQSGAQARSMRMAAPSRPKPSMKSRMSTPLIVHTPVPPLMVMSTDAAFTPRDDWTP
jgi:hypothetical protein